MTQDGRSARKSHRPWSMLVAASLLLGALLSAVTFGAASGPASAQPNSHSCKTDYTGSTVHPCHGTTTSSTNGAVIVVSVKVQYSAGAVDWQACGFPSAFAGSTVELYANGVKLTGAGSSGTVESGGCTPDPQAALCLASGTYTFAAVDHQYSGSSKLTVTSGGCSDPAALAAAAATTSSGLAFTGANALVLLAAASVIIVVGYAIVRLNRQRRRAS